MFIMIIFNTISKLLNKRRINNKEQKVKIDIYRLNIGGVCLNSFELNIRTKRHNLLYNNFL